jgi:formylglycine-generating enzyme required for sulfatase activity
MRGWYLSFFLFLVASQADTSITVAGNGEAIGNPQFPAVVRTQNGAHAPPVPASVVWVPSGDVTIGDGPAAHVAHLPAFAIGKFDVTNAEYKVFLDDTHRSPPRYWKNGTYPEGKAAHPVVFVSLEDARAYAAWVGAHWGKNVAIPTAEEWEKAARGPQGFLYPWGNAQETTYRDGVLKSRFSYNAVTAAYFLNHEADREVTYSNPHSPYYGQKTTVAQIAAFDPSGRPDYLTVSPDGMVRGWVNHQTNTGFIYTDLFRSLDDVGGNTVAVGSYPDGVSGYGAYDMAGNVWNWTETTITATNGAERGREVNEIRGGSWYANGRSCRSISIGEGRDAKGGYNTVGFRIVLRP